MHGLSQFDYNDRRAIESALMTINLEIDTARVAMREGDGKKARRAGRQHANLMIRKARLLDEYKRLDLRVA